MTISKMVFMLFLNEIFYLTFTKIILGMQIIQFYLETFWDEAKKLDKLK